MDRPIIYPGAIPQDTDLLSTNRNTLIALGKLMQDILGTATVVSGLPCTQTVVASLAVLVGPGDIYSLQNVDGTAYGSLAADTTDQILKQGIQLGSVTLGTPAPVTAGQSINYLIEASYQDADSVPVVLPYYNASNPAVPFSGPGNSGAPQNTQRKGTVVMQAKAGIPATTGTQTTPTADAGFIGLYVVTVANGQATVTSANITTLLGAPFLNLNLGSPLVSHLGTNVQFVSNTTLTNTGLSINLPVGVFAIEMLLNFNGTTTGTQGLKLDIFTGSTAVLSGQALGSQVGTVNGVSQNAFFAGNPTFGTISIATIVDVLVIKFSVIVTTAGTFVLRAAQNTSSANATRLLAPSYMLATQV